MSARLIPYPHLLMKQFHLFSAIPDVCDAYARASVLGRAQKNKKIKIQAHDIRHWALGKHKKIDDRPFGGGPGMVLMVEPIYRGVTALLKKLKKSDKKTRVILLSTRGKLFNKKEAKRLARYDALIFICGRYEGVDERVARHIADEEISVGDVVLSGGELPAMMIVDGIARMIPGVLGKFESLEEIKGSYPTYTRPEAFSVSYNGKKKQWRVPRVLLSGNHAHIQTWRARFHR